MSHMENNTSIILHTCNFFSHDTWAWRRQKVTIWIMMHCLYDRYPCLQKMHLFLLSCSMLHYQLPQTNDDLSIALFQCDSFITLSYWLIFREFSCSHEIHLLNIFLWYILVNIYTKYITKCIVTAMECFFISWLPCCLMKHMSYIFVIFLGSVIVDTVWNF